MPEQVSSLPIARKRYPMIAIPVYANAISMPLFHFLAGASQECVAAGWEPPYVQFRTMDAMITRARNVMVAQFLQRTECTDLVFVDGDIGADAGCFTRLMNHPVDLVAGVYRSRGEPQGDPERYILQPFDNELVVDPATHLMEVAGAATGFMRISRHCAERMMGAYGHRWYEDHATAAGLKIPCLFDFEYVPHEHAPGGTYFSEDYTFCRRWRALGEKVWIDPHLTLHHTGEKIYSGKFIEYLNRKYLERNPQPAASILDLAKQYLEEAGARVEISEHPRSTEAERAQLYLDDAERARA